MPVNNKYKISELLQACKSYAEHTGRRISFEYILINNLNDSERHARELASLVKNILAHVNLIPVNRVYKQGEQEFAPPGRKKSELFRRVLENCGINATIRRKCGDDVDASCGQLRAGAE
jgi:23S rRNA (adenine2503-C2)-methyltransferase